MRERSVKVDTKTLAKLSEIYKGSNVADKIGVSKQLFHKYKHGICDMPESTLERLCESYGLDKNAMIVEAV